jgi:hypothetical protein
LNKRIYDDMTGWNLGGQRESKQIYRKRKYLQTGVVVMRLNVKVVSEHHAMKAYWRIGVIVPRILGLGTRWR